MTEFAAVLKTLAAGGVECILIGGAAGIVHGAARVTHDVDLVYRRTPENIERLVRALEPLHPYLRGAGRPKDFEAIAELEALAQERER